MDFVDLDKVLDEFEEEEKASDNTNCGQEVKPTGYVESKLDKPWENLSRAPVENNTILTTIVDQHNKFINYGDPYNSKKLDEIDYDVPPMQKLEQLGLDSKDYFNNTHQTLVTQNYQVSNSQGLGYVITDHFKYKDIDFDPSKHVDDTLSSHGGSNSLKLKINEEKKSESRSSHLQASQVTAVQTDALSPNSERELASYEYPKSDILVDGHNSTSDVVVPNSESINSYSIAKEKQAVQLYLHSQDNNINSLSIESKSSNSETNSSNSDSLSSNTDPKSLSPQVSKPEEKNQSLASNTITADTSNGNMDTQSPEALREDDGPVLANGNTTSGGSHDIACMDTINKIQKQEEPELQGSNMNPPNSSNRIQNQDMDPNPPGTNINPSDSNIIQNQELDPKPQNANTNPPNSVTAIGFSAEDMDMSPEDIDDYLKTLPEKFTKAPVQSLNAESNGEAAIQNCRPNNFASVGSNGFSHAGLHHVPQGVDTEFQQSPQSLSSELDQASKILGAESNQLHQSSASDFKSTPQSLSSELQQASMGLNPENLANPKGSEMHPSLCAELQQAEIQNLNGSPCRHAGDKIDVYSSMEGAVGHSPDASSLETSGYTHSSSGASLFLDPNLNRKGIVSDINISLSQDGDCLEIEQIINDPQSFTEESSPTSLEQNSLGVSFPKEIPGSSAVSSNIDGHFNDQVTLRSQNQNVIGQGARPKDFNHLKKSRPNSLLGLSKVNLETPFAGAHVVEGETPDPKSQDMRPDIIQQVDQTQVMDQSQVNFQQRTEGVPGTSNVNQVLGQSQLNFNQRTEGNLGPSNVNQESNESVPGMATGESSDIAHETGGVEELPVLRRNMEASAQGGLMGSGGLDPRPHSWSPAGSASPQMNKSKRPSSLNIPPRGEFNPEDRGQGARTRGLLTPYSAEVPEESESAVGEEPPEITEDLDAIGAAAAPESESPENPAGNGSDNLPPSIIHTNLGKVAPEWLPDSQAINCMQCQAKFTFTKRRHHCRACGKIFCSLCCSMKSRLSYMDMKEARVCLSCHQILQAADSNSCRPPHPNNPSDYCTTIPPPQQVATRGATPTVLVPSGVLRRDGSQRRSGEPKQVMFSDGIRPGGDLTELDGSTETSLPFRRTGRILKKVEKSQGSQSSPKSRRLKSKDTNQRNLMPEEGLPPLFIAGETNAENQFIENPDPSSYMSKIKEEEAEPVIFAVNKNLFVLVKIINLECCVKRNVWCFTTKGMCTVGQNEMVILLEEEQEETEPPRDIFQHFSNIYDDANKGNVLTDLGHTIFHQSFLGSRDHGGFLYLYPSFQCLQKLPLPDPPYLFAVLLQKWETPWAKVFPLRLLLRLGAEYRYYPCPLVSIRNRKPVFFEIGHTIMNLLADFRNYQYMLPQNKGVYIHMEDKKTVISFPRNRYDDLMKVVNNSNEHVMALGASFSTEADSHLVCIQSDEGNYQTQAINIQNKQRKVTGASFVVFNGALKSSSGLLAKSSIVEDGLMVQITLDSMNALKQAIKDMCDYTIACGSATAPQPEEIVCLQWVEEDRLVNVGVKSPIDGMAMDNIESIRIHKGTDYIGESRTIRWTEVFFIQNEEASSRWEPVDLSRLGEMLASAFCIAMTPHLDRLKEAALSKLGLRVTLDSEQVGYEIGGNYEKIPDFYMNDLDSALIPVIHGAASQNQEGPIIMELIFHVLE